MTGGSLSFVDSKNGRSGIAEPLTGARKGKTFKVEGSGQVDQKEQKTTAVMTQTEKGKAKLVLNGVEVDGALAISKCAAD